MLHCAFECSRYPFSFNAAQREPSIAYSVDRHVSKSIEGEAVQHLSSHTGLMHVLPGHALAHRHSVPNCIHSFCLHFVVVVVDGLAPPSPPPLSLASGEAAQLMWCKLIFRMVALFTIRLECACSAGCSVLKNKEKALVSATWHIAHRDVSGTRFFWGLSRPGYRV